MLKGFVSWGAPAVVAWLLMGWSGPAAAAKMVVLGTGGVTGVYYPVGGAICRLMNASRPFHGIRCLVESTGGSLDNVRRLLEGEQDFGIVQSDVLWKGVQGIAPFESPEEDLRSVFALHAETFVLVVRADSGIHAAPGIRGKRINLGGPGSGTLATAQDALEALELARSDLALAATFGFDEQSAALRGGQIDGFFYLAGHPSHALRELFLAMEARMLPLSGPRFDELTARYPYYVRAAVPAHMYRGVEQAVPTFAVRAVLVTSSDTASQLVYILVKSIFLELESFRRFHPALAPISAQSLVEGLTAPMHPGACRFFEEQGISCPE